MMQVGQLFGNYAQIIPDWCNAETWIEALPIIFKRRLPEVISSDVKINSLAPQHFGQVRDNSIL